jgi:2-methylisocitrate lyase-like PEP mutase family enzyme
VGTIRETLREALGRERPLVTPLAHDALSARLIEAAGFQAVTIGGSALLAARHGLPDIGLVGLADMVAGIRDIATATALPILADGDDGYGDVKCVARLVESYEAIGVGGILIEDQRRESKQQRADKSAAVADEATIESKLRAALAARSGRDTMIVGRTDAFGVLGLDAAIRRAERFANLGADGVFVAGLRKPEEFEKVGRALKGVPLLSAAMFEGGDSAWLTPAELGRMGYTQVSFPTALIFRAAAGMHAALAQLRAYADGRQDLPPLADYARIRGVMDECVRLERWRTVEASFAAAGTPRA